MKKRGKPRAWQEVLWSEGTQEAAGTGESPPAGGTAVKCGSFTQDSVDYDTSWLMSSSPPFAQTLLLA